MIIRVLGVYLLLLVTSCNATIPYLVSLKSTETIESFLNYDILYPKSQQVKALISNSFSFGNFTGFSGNFSKAVLDRLKRCPLVAEVTPDIILKAFDVTTQEDAPRHLARISRKKKLKSGTYFEYRYNSKSQGKGVNAYVLDSGVQLKHPEFENRGKFGTDFTKEGSGDTNGHGTHVAGIIGSKTYGVAKEVDIYEVKVLDKNGSGSLSTIISAIEFVVNHRTRSGRPGVANLSLGAYKNSVLNKAIDAAYNTGLVMVVAAGNSNINACLSSPAGAESALTVGAIDDYSDALASFSNWGECVDVFASGVYVQSLSPFFDEPQHLSGTSMAAPSVAGLVANLMSEGVPYSKVKSTLIEMSLKDKIPKSSLLLRRRTPNRIAYNGIEEYDSDSGSDSDDDD
ncbi:peptidase S8/S53 domain-containing protein [Scheffersomyces coipomensis]|uniref:peptidase S8/S53 domain-containing protein n=1 Tax=Scheffersomyces coipomensis TaxID=1788519 RepID=UPI00315CB55B